MMLQGFLYELTGKEGGSATIKLIPSCPIYKAHFPGYPITPGVTLVQIATEIMGKQLKGARDIKFIEPIFPSADGPVLRYDWAVSEEGRAQVSIFLLPEEKLCVKMTLWV